VPPGSDQEFGGNAKNREKEMKNTTGIVSLMILTAVAQADVVNGSFTRAKAGSIVSLDSARRIGKGWYDSNASDAQFKFTNGSAVLDGVKVTSRPAVIGQFFTYNENGERFLCFDASVLDGHNKVRLQVQLYGYKQITSEKTIFFQNELKLGTADIPVSSGNYKIVELADYKHVGPLGDRVPVTERIPFPASTDYTFYGIRIMVTQLDATDRITVDNICIVAADCRFTRTGMEPDIKPE
jgi:hypothetical protein